MKVVVSSRDPGVAPVVASLFLRVLGSAVPWKIDEIPLPDAPISFANLTTAKQRLAAHLFEIQDDSASYFVAVDVAGELEFDGVYGSVFAIAADATRSRFGFGSSAKFPLPSAEFAAPAAFAASAHLPFADLVSRAVTAALLPFHFFETALPPGAPPELLRFADSLNPLERNSLAAQLKALDFAPPTLVDTAAATAVLDAIPDPPDYSEMRDDIWQNGVQAIAQGQVAVLIMAGGQGSRLRAPVPKALMALEIPSRMTLLEIQLRRIKRLQKLCNARQIPVYILTSDATHSAIAAYLLAHDNFGLAAPTLVKQRQLPAQLPDGRFALADRHKVLAAPNGNGALFQELRDSGALADMRQRGVKIVDVHPIDNALARPADPAFVGAMIYEAADAAVKVIAKRPRERIGTVCKRGGKTVVIEYSEIPEGQEAAYRWGNTGLQLYGIDVIARAAEAELPYHIAVKRELVVGENGEREMTEVRKFERFVFDAFDFCEEVAIVACEREDEFAPVKNSSGAPEDSPETARDLLLAMHRRWAQNAGIAVEGDGIIEFRPETTYQGEGLEPFAKRRYPNAIVV